MFTFNARGEVLRDDSQNVFVSTPSDQLRYGACPKKGSRGPALGGIAGGQGTTYGAITLGVTIKPDVPKPLALVLLRPEVRYDRIIAGAPLYNNGGRDQFTFGGDLVVGF